MNFNRIILAGYLTREPELSYTPNQTAIVSFGMAVNRNWTAHDGSKREEVLFIDCIMFGKRALVIREYCKKGQPLLVEGRLMLDTWEAQDGTKRSKHKVNVENFVFIPTGQKEKGTYNGSTKPQSNQIDDPENIPF